MNIRCPECNSLVDLDRASSDAHFHEIIRVLGKLGAKAKLATEYVDCFRTKRTTALSSKKYLRILSEAAEILETGKFTYDGRPYQTSTETVLEAVSEVCNRDLISLKNHNYLKQVIRGVIEKKRDQHEEKLKSPYRDNKPVKEDDAASPEEVREFVKSITGMVKGMP